MSGLKSTHFDEQGSARMVDVGEKDITQRVAIAQGWIQLSKEVLDTITKGHVKKGDVLGVARLAGIQGAKRTWELIPLCHSLFLNAVEIDFTIDEENLRIYAKSKVKTTGKTGVEMEALTAVSVCLLTIYDMCKSMGKDMEIGGIVLLEKEGGKSGHYLRSEKDERSISKND